MFGFTGDGAGRVQQVVISALRSRGMQVKTNLRPVDSAEQYREMAATLQLAAYIEGDVSGDKRATVHVRSGTTGRRIASVRFSGERNGLPADVSSRIVAQDGVEAGAAVRARRPSRASTAKGRCASTRARR